MFKPQNARQEFEEILRGRGLHERDLNLADGCEALFDFSETRGQTDVYSSNMKTRICFFSSGGPTTGERVSSLPST
jgi:hypothetical protein